MSKQNS